APQGSGGNRGRLGQAGAARTSRPARHGAVLSAAAGRRHPDQSGHQGDRRSGVAAGPRLRRRVRPAITTRAVVLVRVARPPPDLDGAGPAAEAKRIRLHIALDPATGSPTAPGPSPGGPVESPLERDQVHAGGRKPNPGTSKGTP